jgi:hypothetical protein
MGEPALRASLVALRSAEQYTVQTETTDPQEHAEQTFAASANFGFSEPEPPHKPMLAQQAPTGRPETISDARLNANRANSQFSTGPKTEEGKAKSSLNAVKTGLTGRTVFLPTDDIHAY